MSQGQGPRPELKALSRREVDCLRLVQDQMSSKEIGRRLGISPTSVDTHVRRARDKLGVDDRYAAAQLLAVWERDGANPAVDPAPPVRRPASQAWLPPLSSLNLIERLLLVVLGAILGAIAFGAVLTAMAAL